jgi:haloalkane dehalogenase
MPDRVESLTILNTLVDVQSFKKPWPMRPFERSILGEAWLKGMNRPGLRLLMRLVGVHDMSAVSKAEFGAYLRMLKLDDGGRAFLKIMRAFETTPAKESLYRSVLADATYPIQVVWGEHDPALKIGTFGEAAKRAAGLDTIHRLPAKHFLQEDQPGPLAEKIATFTFSSDT